MKFAPHALVLAVALLVGGWAFGFVTVGQMARGSVGAVAVFFVIAVVSIVPLKRRGTSVSYPPQRYFTAKAVGRIEHGDLVRLDAVTHTAARVDTVVQ
jgi:membrane protein YdbS with pleckstrin-like domain